MNKILNNKKKQQDAINNNNNENSRWLARFNQLCYETFAQHEQGKELLAMMEERFLKEQIAYPGTPSDYTFFNEGRNQLVRTFKYAIEQHLSQGKTKR